MNKLGNREVKIKSSLKNFHLIEQFVDEISDFYNINNSYYGNILIAITEAFENAVVHGNQGVENRMISIKFQNEPYGFDFIISDEGKGFNYKKIPETNDFFDKKSKKEKKGFFLIKMLTDGIEFNEKGNEIKLIFKISSINKELSIRRINSLNEYNQEIQKITHLKKQE
jgi:serine/threonine-protein kinase RsbW